MKQESVRDPLQTGNRLLVVNDHRIVGQVGAGHDQRREIFHQEIVERCIGQHQPQITIVADPDRDSGFFVQQYDGPPPAGEERLLVRTDFAQLTGCIHIGAHQGEGFFVPVLAGAQLGNGFAFGQAGQMESAKTLDGHDLTAMQRSFGRLQRCIVTALPCPVHPMECRAAVRAAGGLGVIAPVNNVAILRLTGPAHGKASHGGSGAVVRHIPDDGKPGAAVGAVEERVTIPPVGGIIQFLQAVGTGAHVRADQRLTVGKNFAFQNAEALIACRRGQIGALHTDDHRQRGLLRSQCGYELFQTGFFSLQLQLHSG